MTSPPTAAKPLQGATNFFGNLFRLRRNKSFGEIRDGSSKRGRRFYEDDLSAGRDSSTRSIIFDLELSQRGGGSQRGHPTTADIISRLQLATLESATTKDHDTITQSPTATTATRQTHNPAKDADPHRVQAILTRITYLGRPSASFEVDLLQDVQSLRPGATDAKGVLDLHRLALDLIAMGYECVIQSNRHQHDAGVGAPSNYGDGAAQNSSALTNKQGAVSQQQTSLEYACHGFLVCSGRLDGSIRHHCLVDPRFRDQFKLGKPTDAYSIILQSVPVAFVGSPLRLQALADVLCNQIAIVYKLQRMTLPPWRRSSAMLSRWFDVQTPAPVNNSIIREDINSVVGGGGSSRDGGGGGGGGSNNNRSHQHDSTSTSGISTLPGNRKDTKNGDCNICVSTTPSGVFTHNNNNNNNNNSPSTIIERESSDQLTPTSSGGSAQFYAMVAVHQESLKRQREHRSMASDGNGSASIRQTMSATDVASEKSNKPRRQQQLYMLQQQQDINATSARGGDGSTSAPAVKNATALYYSGMMAQQSNTIVVSDGQYQHHQDHHLPLMTTHNQHHHEHQQDDHEHHSSSMAVLRKSRSSSTAVYYEPDLAPIIESPHPRYVLHENPVEQARQRQQQTQPQKQQKQHGVVSLLAQGLKNMKKGMVKVSSKSPMMGERSRSGRGGRHYSSNTLTSNST